MNEEMKSLELVLARARAGLSPSDAQLRRIESGVFGTALPDALRAPGASGDALGVSDPAPVAGRWAALQATGGVGLAAAALLVVGGFVAGYLAHPVLVRREIDPAPAPAVALLASTQAAPAPLAPTPERAETAAATASTVAEPIAHALASASPPRTGGRAGSPRQRTARSSPSAGAAELALLERIDRALRNADAPLALTLLGELERQHPRTHLDEERRAARALADCLGGGADAGARAHALLEARPASVYASRLRAVCQIE
jgi:hypothetical protein